MTTRTKPSSDTGGRRKGVLTIAYGRQKYVTQAINLARSIRLRDPHLPLAVATDLPAAAFADHYDEVIPWDFSEWPELVSKLELYALTPFDTTLFLDADCLVVRSLEQVFGYFEGQDFAVFGRNAPDAIWFRSVAAVQAVVPSPTYPIFNGGLYYFTRSARAEEVFRRARALFPHYDHLQLHRSRTQRENDEPLISLAMAQLGLQAMSTPGLDILHAPERPHYDLHLDVLGGESRFVRRGQVVEPIVTHFVGVRDQLYVYQRESLRLAVADRGLPFPWCHDWVIAGLAYARWFVAQVLPRYRRQLQDRCRRALHARLRARAG